MSKSMPEPTAPSTVMLRAGRAVHFKAELHQVIDHLLNQCFVCAFLHGNNHGKQLLAFSF